MLKYISYISQQAHILSDPGLEELLLNCRKNNLANNITGLLVYYQGIFIQYIEGEPGEVDKLFKMIRGDSRHHNVIQLEAGLQENRQFAKWSMAFKKLDHKEVGNIIGYQNFRREKVFRGNREYANHYAMKLLNSFVNNL